MPQAFAGVSKTPDTNYCGLGSRAAVSDNGYYFMARLLPVYLSMALLLAAWPAFGQGARGTVLPDSLKVYLHMSAESDVVATLQHGATVQIESSITGEGGTWCGISRIEPKARLGYVICNQLQREAPPPKPNPAPAAPEPASAAQASAAAPAPLTGTQKAWALAASALLTESNMGHHNTLAESDLTPGQIRAEKQSLSQQWGIEDRTSLLLALSALDQAGHRSAFATIGQRVSGLSEQDLQAVLASVRGDKDATHGVTVARKYYQRLGDKSLVGWDYSRYISLCRWGYSLGYLSAEEAWQGIMHAARIIRNTFSSWRELGENYLIGREFWSYEQTQQDGKFMREVCDRLLSDAHSPWNRIPWAIDLGGAGQ